MSEPGSRTINLGPETGGMSIPRLLFALLRQRFSGALTVGQRDPAGTRTVWFRGGMPIFTDWAKSGDRLGELLVARGVITAAQLERALAAHASGNGRFGEILIDLQLLDRPGLTEALRDQCVGRLIEMFAADVVDPTASIRSSTAADSEYDAFGQVNVLALLQRGIRARFDDARISRELGTALGGDLVATPALPRYERQFGFEPADAAILAALARGVTMSGLMVPGIDPTRALQIVYTLWATQMIRSGDDAIQAIANGATAAAAANETKPVAPPAAAPPTPVKPKPEPKPEPKPAPKPELPPLPKPEDLPPLAPEPDVFGPQLLALEAKVAERAHAFALFGIDHDADRKQIRAAWAELSKTYHPDGVEGSGRAALRDRVERVFAALSEAYGVLSDQDQREKLRAALTAGGGTLSADEDTGAVVRNAFEAERLGREGDKLLNAREWARAAEMFARAHELSPKDSDIEAAMVFAEFRRSNSADPSLALVQLDKVVTETPNCARAHYFKGLLELGRENLAIAKLCFATAHKLDPRNIDAERQLRAIRMRERAAAPPKPDPKDDKKLPFGLGRLFKKD
jgi:hypothetical protein